MSEQRQFNPSEEVLRPRATGDDDTEGAERLVAARAELDRIFAVADAILDDIRVTDSQRFLEQVRQRGGQ